MVEAIDKEVKDEIKEPDADLIGKEAEISTPDSKVKVFVIPTDEEAAIANDTYELTRQKAERGNHVPAK